MKQQQGSLIVISGPSGVGKSTVISEVLAKHREIYFSVSFTTRPPREGEMDGVNYNFVDQTEFQRMIEAGELLEYAEYVGNYYGTSLKLVMEKLNQGVDVLLDIEVQGAANVKKKMPEAVLIFILPPSFEELSKRLHARRTDSEQKIASRLEQARREYREVYKYDYIVMNEQVVRAASEVEAILTAERCRMEKRIYLAEGV